MSFIPVNTIEVKEDGTVEINTASTVSNDDWMRSARLIKSSKKKDKKQLKKMDSAQTAYIIEE